MPGGDAVTTHSKDRCLAHPENRTSSRPFNKLGVYDSASALRGDYLCPRMTLYVSTHDALRFRARHQTRLSVKQTHKKLNYLIVAKVSATNSVALVAATPFIRRAANALATSVLGATLSLLPSKTS